MTIVGMTLVDRKGRKFLFTVGTSGIIVSLVFVGVLFLRTEKHRFDVARRDSSPWSGRTRVCLHFDQADRQAPASGQCVLRAAFLTGCRWRSSIPTADSTAATTPVRSEDRRSARQHQPAEQPALGQGRGVLPQPLCQPRRGAHGSAQDRARLCRPVPDAVNGWLVAHFPVRFRRLLRAGARGFASGWRCLS